MSLRRKFAWIALICVAGAAFWIASSSTEQAGVSDFAAYWTAAHEVAAGRNPYDSDAILAAERRLGFAGNTPLVMRNPPWVIPFVAPLGLFSYEVARRLWFMICLALVLVSVDWLWRLYASAHGRVWIGWVVAGMFVPVATVLAIGQISPLILLGIAGFLHFEKKGWYGWAGASALLVTLKPHLVFLFWLALLLWCLRKKHWQTLGILAGGLLLASGVAMLLDSHIFRQYFELWGHAAILQQSNPTPSGALGVILKSGGRWIGYAPVILATAWFLVHWIRAGTQWRWQEQLPILLLVSFVVTPYAWFFDQAVLLPAILQVAAQWSDLPERKWLWPALIYLGINLLTLEFIAAHHTFFWYAWTAPAWLLFYLWQRWQNLKPPATGEAIPSR